MQRKGESEDERVHPPSRPAIGVVTGESEEEFVDRRQEDGWKHEWPPAENEDELPQPVGEAVPFGQHDLNEHGHNSAGDLDEELGQLVVWVSCAHGVVKGNKRGETQNVEQMAQKCGHCVCGDMRNESDDGSEGKGREMEDGKMSCSIANRPTSKTWTA